MTTTAPIELLGPLELLPGTGLGYRAALAFGGLGVRQPVPSEWFAVRSALGQVLALPFDEDAARPCTEASVVDDLLAMVTAVQQMARVPLFETGRTLQIHAATGPRRRVDFVMPCSPARSAQLALVGLIEIVCLCLSRQGGAADADPGSVNTGTSVDTQASQLLQKLKPFRLPGNNTMRFLRAAIALDIPAYPVVANVFALGQGRYQRWLDSSFTERTSVLGTAMVRQKHLAAAVLRANGFPVADHHLAADADAAVRVAHQLGFPVVVKPADMDGGAGVAADLRDDAAVRTAFAQARQHSSRVLVERHVQGEDFRLTVANGRMIKAVHRLPGGVFGDGMHSVAALIDLANMVPKRMKRNRDRAAILLQLDDEARVMLAEKGWSPETVLPAGEFIALRRRANVSTGGEPSLVTDHVHPDNQRLAERAAQTLKLDLAGVDLIIGDISRSWLEIGASICEVNAQPQIGDGTTPQIYADILRELLHGDARIPVVLVIDDDPSMAPESVPRSLQSMLEAKGLRCARASRAGVWMGPDQQVCPGSDWFKAARVALNLGDAAAVVLVASTGEIRATGLPCDRVQSVVLKGWSADAPKGRSSLDSALRMVLPHLTGNLVLDAGDPALVWLADRIDKARITVVEAPHGGEPAPRWHGLALAALAAIPTPLATAATAGQHSTDLA